MAAASASAWGSALHLAVLPAALGFVPWGYAIAKVPTAVSTSLRYLVAALAILMGWIGLGGDRRRARR